MAHVSVPSRSALPPYLRVDPTHALAVKILSRLSRPSLLSLVADWLGACRAQPRLYHPYLGDGDDDDSTDPYPPARSLEELEGTYSDLTERKGSKRELITRIIHGDWRHGLTLQQLAEAEIRNFRSLSDHAKSHTWTAYRIIPQKLESASEDADERTISDWECTSVPWVNPSLFVHNLQKEALPDLKVHYHCERHPDLPATICRLFITSSPYNNAHQPGGRQKRPANFPSSQTVLLAFPEAAPFLYVSKIQSDGVQAAGEHRSLRSLLVDGIRKALSVGRRRHALQATGLTTKNLDEMLDKRGAGRMNSAGGGWGVYAYLAKEKRESPLDMVLPSSQPLSEENEGRETLAGKRRATSPTVESALRGMKRRMLVAKARFGESARMEDGKGVERVEVLVEDVFPEAAVVGSDGQGDRGDDEKSIEAANAKPKRLQRPGGLLADLGQLRVHNERDADADNESGIRPESDGVATKKESLWRPSVRLTMQGSHVFAGIRQLVEHGVLDGERMPGWLTGEEGVTSGVVRDGRIRRGRGSGFA